MSFYFSCISLSVPWKELQEFSHRTKDSNKSMHLLSNTLVVTAGRWVTEYREHSNTYLECCSLTLLAFGVMGRESSRIHSKHFT